jgi:hypothetical protein
MVSVKIWHKILQNGLGKFGQQKYLSILYYHKFKIQIFYKQYAKKLNIYYKQHPNLNLK